MEQLKIGDAAPTFSFECTEPNITCFKDLLGKKIVLYFYPKDNTPGCTLEGKDFSTLKEQFSNRNVILSQDKCIYILL